MKPQCATPPVAVKLLGKPQSKRDLLNHGNIPLVVWTPLSRSWLYGAVVLMIRS